jgi:hypothetical protein
MADDDLISDVPAPKTDSEPEFAPTWGGDADLSASVSDVPTFADTPHDNSAAIPLSRLQVRKPPNAATPSHAPPKPGKPPAPQGTNQTQFQKATSSGKDKELSWGDAFSGAANNFLPSLGSMAGSVVNAAVHPVETVQTLGQLAQGAGSQVAGALGAQQDPKQKAKDEALVKALEDHYKEAYGSVGGFKKYLSTDPAGVLSDVSTVATMGTSGIGTGAKVLSAGADAAGLSNAAKTLSNVGNVASKASKIAANADPVALALKTAKGTAGIAGKVVGPMAAGMSAVATGKRVGAIVDAAKAGASSDPELRAAFKAHLTGAADPTELTEAVGGGLQTLKNEREANFVQNMQNMSAQGYTVDWGDVDNAISDAKQSVNYINKNTGQATPISAKANDAIDEIADAADDFKSDPSLESMHAFKQRVGDIRQSYGANPQANRVATKIYNSALDSLKSVAPDYANTMKSYGEASDLINEISQTFKMGGRNATADKQLKALLATKTGSQKETLISQLQKVNPRIPYMLAGQELSSWKPEGLRSAILSSPLSYANPMAAAASAIGASPRLAGSVALNAGRVARLSQPLFSPLAAKSLRAAGQSLDDRPPLPGAPPQAEDSPSTINESSPAASNPNEPPINDKDGIPLFGASPDDDGPQIEQLKQHIQKIESGGNKSPYSVVGPKSSNGDRPYGAYQVMGKNIPVWTHEILGRAMTPEEFLASPDAQEAVAHAKLAEYYRKTGNLADAAAMWHSGRTVAQAGNARDALGTYTRDYAAKASDGIQDAFFEGGRVGRAAGGATLGHGHEYLVNRLLMAAKNAKKATDKTTEPLLKVPDEHIVKALNVAQRAI